MYNFGVTTTGIAEMKIFGTRRTIHRQSSTDRDNIGFFLPSPKIDHVFFPHPKGGPLQENFTFVKTRIRTPLYIVAKSPLSTSI